MAIADTTPLGTGALLLILGLAVLAALALIEILLRLIDDVPVLSAANFVVRSPALIHGIATLRHDPTLGWCFKDDLRLPTGMFTTGRYGLRMNDATRREPPQGGVLAIGDSFTASGTADADTWPAQLERLIGKPVLNAACGGWGVDQMVLRAEQLIPLLRPETVIVAVLVPHDVHRACYELFGGSRRPWFALDGDRLEARGLPVATSTAASLGLNRWQRIFGHWYTVHRIVSRLAPETWLPTHAQSYRATIPHDAGTALSCRLLARLAAFAKQHGTRVAVALLWGAGEVRQEPTWPDAAVLVDAAEALGLGVLDLQASLRAVARADPTGFEALWLVEGGVLGHPSAAGNGLIARELRAAFFAEPA